VEKEIIFSLPNSIEPITLEKSAAKLKENISPEIKRYIANLKPDSKYMYLLSTPMGASEYYGKNRNGDFFSEKALNPPDGRTDYGYKTFERANIFEGHDNKDPEKAIGSIDVAAYNKDLHRVETIMKIDRDKAPHVAERIERNEEKRAGGEIPDDNYGISMGCKLLSGDRCSICGKANKSRLEYCEHLSTMMNEMLPDGRIVYADNPEPVFFDLSMVEAPAANESAILKKVAQDLNDKAKINPLTTIRNTEKSTDSHFIKKARKVIDWQRAKEESFDKDILNKLANINFEEMISTTSLLGIVLRPEEFQYIALKRANEDTLAEKYAEHNLIFPSVDDSIKIDSNKTLFNESINKLLSPFLASRSSFEPFLSQRMIKSAAKINKDVEIFENPLLIKISSLYNGYREYLIKNLNTEKLIMNMSQHPNVIGSYLETTIPEFKMASFEELSTPKKIAQGMISDISLLYLILY
jgi:hypothetical protein